MCRQLLKENPKDFLAQLARLERAHSAARVKGEAPTKFAESEAKNTDLSGLIDRLLEEYEREQREGAAVRLGGRTATGT